MVTTLLLIKHVYFFGAPCTFFQSLMLNPLYINLLDQSTFNAFNGKVRTGVTNLGRAQILVVSKNFGFQKSWYSKFFGIGVKTHRVLLKKHGTIVCYYQVHTNKQTRLTHFSQCCIMMYVPKSMPYF